MTIFSSSGWSLTGGPWVKPEQAMKKLVWSETNVEGPMKFNDKLPQPPSNNGSFGGLRGLNYGRGGRGVAAARENSSSTQPGPGGTAASGARGPGPGARGSGIPVPTYYGDSAVIAFRTPPTKCPWRNSSRKSPAATARSIQRR